MLIKYVKVMKKTEHDIVQDITLCCDCNVEKLVMRLWKSDKTNKLSPKLEHYFTRLVHISHVKIIVDGLINCRCLANFDVYLTGLFFY